MNFIQMETFAYVHCNKIDFWCYQQRKTAKKASMHRAKYIYSIEYRLCVLCSRQMLQTIIQMNLISAPKPKINFGFRFVVGRLAIGAFIRFCIRIEIVFYCTWMLIIQTLAPNDFVRFIRTTLSISVTMFAAKSQMIKIKINLLPIPCRSISWP